MLACRTDVIFSRFRGEYEADVEQEPCAAGKGAFSAARALPLWGTGRALADGKRGKRNFLPLLLKKKGRRTA